MNKLFEDNLKLAYFYANQFNKKYYYTTIELSDLTQEALIALNIAVNNYDPNRSTNFSSYISFCIKHHLSRYIKRQNKNFEFTCDNKDALEFLEENSIRNYDTDLDDIIDINLALGKLSDKYRDIVEMHFLEGYSMQHIGDKYGVSRQRINDILQRSINKLQMEMEHVQ